MDLHLQLRPTNGTFLEDSSRCRNIMASLFISLVFAQSVHILGQFVSIPTSTHFGHLLPVLRYFLSVCSTLVTVCFSFMLTPLT
jgi:hypothetical protein